MKYVLIPILVLCAMWMLWYLSGGPLRESSKKPFVGLGSEGKIELQDNYNPGSLDLKNR